MPYTRDRAIILRTEPYRDRDLRVVGYGRGYGKFSAVARGVRVMGAKHTGHLEPLSEVDCMIAKGSAFDKLAVARRRDGGADRSYSSHAFGLLVAAYIDALIYPDDPEIVLYELLQEALHVFDGVSRAPSSMRAQFLYSMFVLKTLTLFGLIPELGVCHECRADIRQRVSFYTPLGALVCEACRGKHPSADESLPERTLGLATLCQQSPLEMALRVTATHEVLQGIGTLAELYSVLSKSELSPSLDDVSRFFTFLDDPVKSV